MNSLKLADWLWLVFGAIALFVVYGYFKVRAQNKREENKMDAADTAERKREAAEHQHGHHQEHHHKHKGVE
jgi:ABC-type nickel/cobalt efflux system permease component RcnA